MRSQAVAQHPRRILCVFPRYTPSFGTFEHAYELTGVKAFMPPQGILVIAAYLPEKWEVRFVDENIRAATDDEFAWADAVFVSGMHVQSAGDPGHRRAAPSAPARSCVLGGPSVSACPEHYPRVRLPPYRRDRRCHRRADRALDDDLARRRRSAASRPTSACRCPTFPIPAYQLIEGGNYMLGSVQFSSGCPYRCEFCDIPALYGRQPRLKEPKQILAELDAMLARGPLRRGLFRRRQFHRQQARPRASCCRI